MMRQAKASPQTEASCEVPAELKVGPIVIDPVWLSVALMGLIASA
jgi:hypothetical protein